MNVSPMKAITEYVLYIYIYIYIYIYTSILLASLAKL